MLNTAAPESQPSTRSTPTSQPPSQSSNNAGPVTESKRPKRQHPKGGGQPPSEQLHQRPPPRHNQWHDRQPGAPSDVSSPQRQYQRVNQKLSSRADPVPQHSPSSPRTPTAPASASTRDKNAVRAVTNTSKSKSKRNSASSSSQPPTYQHHAGDGTEDSMTPSKFITIADPIDPVRIVKGKSGTIEVVNGCDLYVDWVERSLKAFDQVVLIGIEPAIANVVSIVNILEQSGMGGHHDLETFTSEGSIGIQFKLHRGPVLENEMVQNRSLHRALSG